MVVRFLHDFTFPSDLLISTEMFLKEGTLYSCKIKQKINIVFNVFSKLNWSAPDPTQSLCSQVLELILWFFWPECVHYITKLSNLNYKNYRNTEIQLTYLLYWVFLEIIALFSVLWATISSDTNFGELKFIRDKKRIKINIVCIFLQT